MHSVSLMTFSLTAHCMKNRERIVDLNSWGEKKSHFSDNHAALVRTMEMLISLPSIRKCG